MAPRFPHREPFEVEGASWSADEIIEALGPHLTDERKARIGQVVDGRTWNVVTVLDGLYDRGNQSAVMRSAEAMGVPEMHLVETQTGFKAANRVTQGADKWLDVRRWTSATPCAQELKARGYRIVCTHLDASVPIAALDYTTPTALVLGNERDGVSDEMLALCDERIIIPMMGFAQSFNISVAAALSLYHIVTDRVRRAGRHGDLRAEEQRILTAEYYLRATSRPLPILRRARGE